MPRTTRSSIPLSDLDGEEVVDSQETTPPASPVDPNRTRGKLLSGGRDVKDTSPRDTLRVERFVYYYCSGETAEKAAILAGFSPRSARSGASHLLDNAGVQSMIRDRMASLSQEIQESSILSAREVLREMSIVTASDLRKLFDNDGRLIPIKELPDDIARAVSSFKIIKRSVSGQSEPELEFQYKLWDKISAADKLLRYYGLLDGSKSEEEPSIPVVDIDPETLNPEQQQALFEAIKLVGSGDTEEKT